jgi:hypothetical protein
LLRFKGECYHPYHFNCKLCSCELNSSAREIRGDLYCLRCHEKLNIPICAACRTPIDQQRIVNALGKQWHVEHFACAKCEIPFNGSRHFEKRGLAYCETHYNQLFGNVCFSCNKIIAGDGKLIIKILLFLSLYLRGGINKLLYLGCFFKVFSFMNKSWCVEHFQCYLCDELMNQK